MSGMARHSLHNSDYLHNHHQRRGTDDQERRFSRICQRLFAMVVLLESCWLRPKTTGHVGAPRSSPIAMKVKNLAPSSAVLRPARKYTAGAKMIEHSTCAGAAGGRHETQTKQGVFRENRRRR